MRQHDILSVRAKSPSIWGWTCSIGRENTCPHIGGGVLPGTAPAHNLLIPIVFQALSHRARKSSRTAYFLLLLFYAKVALAGKKFLIGASQCKNNSICSPTPQNLSLAEENEPLSQDHVSSSTVRRSRLLFCWMSRSPPFIDLVKQGSPIKKTVFRLWRQAQIAGR